MASLNVPQITFISGKSGITNSSGNFVALLTYRKNITRFTEQKPRRQRQINLVK